MRVLLFILISCAASVFGQDKLFFTKFGKGNNTYWMLEPEKHADTTLIVVFLHGHGASNPANYGDWLLHLAEQKLIVVFPKFQTGAFVPDPFAEQDRIQQNIDSAQAYLVKKYGGSSRRIHFIGHSLGGLLAANIADDYGQNQKYKVSSLTLVQPGHKYVKIGTLRSYDHIDSTTRVICVSGSNDRTAGTTFGRYFMSHTPKIPEKNKIHFLLERRQHGSEVIGSTHEEPVCPSDKLDAGNRNPIIRGADLIGKTDLADRRCFWKMADALVAEPKEVDLKRLGDLGFWKDGEPIGSMEVVGL